MNAPGENSGALLGLLVTLLMLPGIKGQSLEELSLVGTIMARA
jgi:hypothetical protein